VRRLVLVLGAAGQLGEVMTEHLASHHEVLARTRAELDVTDVRAVRDAIASLCPDVIVNCSAYTKVDDAERDPLQALSVNALAVRTMARAAAEIDATLVHYSTDFVFAGTEQRELTEEDPPNPGGMYALTKLLGEWHAADAPRHYVLRVESLFGGPSARSSVDKLLDGIVAGREVRAFCDRTVSPSFVFDVAQATSALIERNAPFGLYHCVNTGWTTWSALARELARIVDSPDAQIVDVPMKDAALLANRPQYAALSNAKLTAAGIPMPTWQDALARYVKRP